MATVAIVIAHAGAEPDRCTEFRAAAQQRAGVVSGAGAETLVIGDSYSVGLGVALRDSWPSRLPGKVRVDGFSGSGFSRGASPCGDVSYAARAPHSVRDDTALVVVEGGLNDADQPEVDIVAGFEKLMQRLEGRRVVVVGPPNAPARAQRVATVDRLLAELAERHGAPYVSMLEHELPYLADGLHLTTEGHHAFGDAVATALREMSFAS